MYDKLLDLGLKVYVPIAYTGHDCIVRGERGRHIDVEIKSLSPGRDAYSVGDLEVRDDFFVVLHTLEAKQFWVLPSEIYRDHSRLQKDGSRQLILGQKKQRELGEYRDDFKRIKEAVYLKRPKPKVRMHP